MLDVEAALDACQPAMPPVPYGDASLGGFVDYLDRCTVSRATTLDLDTDRPLRTGLNAALRVDRA